MTTNDYPIDALYAFMSVDDEGNHGVVACVLPGLGSTPMITGSKKAAEGLKPQAIEIARSTGMKIGLFAFDRGEMMWKSP